MTEERQPEHSLHPERVADRSTDEHRDRHAQKRRAGDRCLDSSWFKSKVDPSAGKISPRVTNEKAEATRAMQLATNNRRGFMRSVSEANRSPSHGEKLVAEAGIVVR